MREFSYVRATDINAAAHAAQADPHAIRDGTFPQYLAGGTTLIDLMKLDVMRPRRLVDINEVSREEPIKIDSSGLHLSAFARMAEVADDKRIRAGYPVIAQSLDLAASPQIRNMASLGGNVLQRTRCSYFRDTSWKSCNKRAPGSGCAALDGVNRKHAVLGTSADCIATYPGDFAQALLALDAEVEIAGLSKPRRIPFEQLHLAPGKTPHIETTLHPGELIVGFTIPASALARRSLYLKVRDRESYEFALASAAVALQMDGDRVRNIRIALGGLATKPWRSKESETALAGKALTREAALAAAEAAFNQAIAHRDNKFRIALGKRTLVRALLAAKAMEA